MYTWLEFFYIYDNVKQWGKKIHKLHFLHQKSRVVHSCCKHAGMLGLIFPKTKQNQKNEINDMINLFWKMSEASVR